jgi:filamentous hemagglutinin family protein
VERPLAFIGKCIVLMSEVFAKELEMNANRCRRKRVPRIASKLFSFIALLLFSVNTAFALPSGQQVVNGQAAFNTQGGNLTITNSPNAIINWQGFSINANEAVRFIQQSSASTVLNRVVGQDPSRILGLLQSNGRVFLINPNGILFGQGARIDVNGLVASTLNISNQDFLAGKYNFTAGAVAGSIQNQGTITTPEGGKVYLIAPNVENSGIINSPRGDVMLAAGHNVQLVDSFQPDIAVVVSAPENTAVNLGQILAQSGKVGIYGGLISQKGIVNADSAVVGENGRIFLKASKDVTLDVGSITSATGGTIKVLGDMENGTVRVSGTLDASAPNGGDGGFIETSAAHVKVDDSARITTLAPYGRAGTWLIDPLDYTIAASGGDITGTALSTNLLGGPITIFSSGGATGINGDIFVNDTVSWSANSLTLNAYRNIYINSTLNGSGAARLALLYGQGAADGSIGGVPSTYSVKAPVNLPAGANFSTRLGSEGTLVDYTVITSLGAAADATTAPGTTTLQGMAATANLAGNFALGANIDASATSGWNSGAGFMPVGGGIGGYYFTGTFDGLGHTISDLYISRPTTNNVGLFGYNYIVVRNIGLVGGNIKGQSNVGSLVGLNTGSISSSYSTGAVTGTSTYVGGLVGFNNTGTITNSYSTGAVNSTASYVGGLVGSNSYGTITNSYSTGAVSGASVVGGLSGYNSNGTITNTYSTGAVTGTGSYVGGLVGYNAASGNISYAYSTGAVSGTGVNVGGLIGGYLSGTITNSYWDINTSGQETSAGVTPIGINSSTGTINAYNQTTYTGFDFTSGSPIWWISEGNTRPFLRSEYSTTITNAHQLQLMAMNLAANYTLASNVDASATNGAAYPSGMWTSKGFVPVGNSGGNFTGVFDGLDHTISGLYISRPLTDGVGLFGYNAGVVRNVGLVNGDITGQYAVGGLVGYNEGDITNTHSTGAVSGSSSVGGLAGVNYGTIINSCSTGTVSGTDFVGGLVGYNSGEIDSSWNEGNVTGITNVGGIAGGNIGYGIITDSYSTGAVTGTDSVGGLVGANDTSEGDGVLIANSYSTGTVTGSTNVGGLVGYNSGAISNSHYDIDNVTINGAYYVTEGGLYTSQYQSWVNGYYAPLSIDSYSASLPMSDDYYTIGTTQGLKDMLGFVDNSAYKFRLTANLDLADLPGWYLPVFSGLEFDGAGYILANLSVNQPFNDNIGFIGRLSTSSTLTGLGLTNVNITGGYNIGGLVGWNQGSIINSASSGTVNGNSYIGGLVGINYGGAITNSYSTGTVEGTGNYVGGLVGENYGTITNSYSTGTVNGDSYVGGLAGYNEGSISNSYSTGTVIGNSYIGGLVGANYEDVSSGVISNSYSTGTVEGTGGHIGGLVGVNYFSSISDSYSTSAVTGSNYVGGLVGENYSGTITNTYSTGLVTATGPGASVGGLVGYDSIGEGVSNSFWDIDTSGQASSNGGTEIGYATVAMMTQTTFTSGGWDFAPSTGVWWMSNGNTRPFLQSEWRANITNAHQLQLMALNLSESYTLAGNIDMSELAQASGLWNTTTGFAPVGNITTPFTGVFDGLDHSITNLCINRPDTNYIGLFGYTDSAVIRNVGLVNGTIAGKGEVGGLVGRSEAIGGGTATITNSSSSAAVSGSFRVGGLVGVQYSSGSGSSNTIENSYSTGAITGGGGLEGIGGWDDGIGGLVGFQEAFISGVSTISNSYHSTGLVHNLYGGSAGGLVGLQGANSGGVPTITNSYNTAAVAGGDYVGGLVGYGGGGSINNSYNTGAVTGSTNVGGLAGLNDGIGISNSFWNKTTAGVPYGIGLDVVTWVGEFPIGSPSDTGATGLTTAQMTTQASFGSWDFTGTWGITPGTTYPYLLWQSPGTYPIPPGTTTAPEILGNPAILGNTIAADNTVVALDSVVGVATPETLNEESSDAEGDDRSGEQKTYEETQGDKSKIFCN